MKRSPMPQPTKPLARTAERHAWAVKDELAAWQSISKSVVAMYQAVRA